MEISIAYAPTAADRKLEMRASALSRLRHWWLIGAPLSLTGIGVLAKLSAASSAGSLVTGCAALGAAAGVVILALPYRRVEEGVRAELRRPFDERQVTLSDAGVRVSTAGRSSDVAWSAIRSAAETPTHWHIAFDAYRTMVVPKSAVADSRAADISRLLGSVAPAGRV